MVTTNFWGSTFVPWEAKFDIDFRAAISAYLAESVVLEGNMVAGAERIGIYVIGDVCPGESLGTAYNHSVRNNTVYAALAGVAAMPKFVYPQATANVTCALIRNFTLFKNFHWGLYHQTVYSLLSDSNVYVDNRISKFSMILEPAAGTHLLGSKFDIVSNSLFVGQSSAFNCTRDVTPNSTLSYQYAGNSKPYGVGFADSGKVGLTWANFLGTGNGAPYKPW